MSKQNSVEDVVGDFRKEFPTNKTHHFGWGIKNDVEDRIIDFLRQALANQDKLTRDSILEELPKEQKVTTEQAVCDDNECMIRKQNIKGFNDCLNQVKNIINK